MRSTLPVTVTVFETIEQKCAQSPELLTLHTLTNLTLLQATFATMLS